MEITIEDVNMHQGVVLLFAVLFYASMIWGAFSLFAVPCDSAKIAKRIVSALGGTATVTVIALLVVSPVRTLGGAVAIVLYTCALVLFWSAYMATRRRPLDFAFSRRAPARLETHGPYRILRHPFYSSYVLGWAAPFAATLSPWAAGILVVMVALYIYAALLEEHSFALSPLAAEYEIYRRQTWRLIPFVY